MKKWFLFLLIFSSTLTLCAQSFNQEKIALAKFIERMYKSAPFEGCRIVDDYDNSYLISVVELDKTKYKTSSVMNRVAQVKSQRNAGEYFNGTQSYSEITIRTPKSQEKGEKDMSETYEIIKINSIGYVKQMELLTSFEIKYSMIYAFYKRIN